MLFARHDDRAALAALVDGSGFERQHADLANTSLGDTGNVICPRSRILQARAHRARTGEGQFVHTSIVTPTC